MTFVGKYDVTGPATALGDLRGLGRSVVAGDVRVYDVSLSATPEERFRTALNLLSGGLARRAEELIRQVVEEGYRGNRVAYYWALAVLSERSLDDLGEDGFSTLRHCSAMVDPGSQDDWLAALQVVMMFVDCMAWQGGFTVEAVELDRVVAGYNALHGVGLVSVGGTVGGGYLVVTVGRRWAVARERIAADDVRYGAEPATKRYSGGFELADGDDDDSYQWGPKR